MTQQWNAQDYARHAQAQQQWASELIDKIDFHQEMHILDIGCGNGKITHKLAEKVPNGSVLGIDADQSMIALATKTWHASNLHFSQMPAENVSVPYAFDFVFSNATLHWIKDHNAVLRGVAEILKPGGKFLFQMGGKGNVKTVMKAVHVVIGRKYGKAFEGFQFPYNFASPADFVESAKGTGIQITRAELIPKTMRKTKDEFCGWFRTTWFPVISVLPNEWHSNFINEVADTLFATSTVKKGVAQIPMIRLEVEGIKTGNF